MERFDAHRVVPLGHGRLGADHGGRLLHDPHDLAQRPHVERRHPLLRPPVEWGEPRPGIRLGQKPKLKIAWTTKGKKATGTVRLQAKRNGTWVSVTKVKVTKGKAKVKVKPAATTC